MKRKIKILIDVIMTILFIILMGYFVTGNKIHEILGTITFVLFILHHILNINWYKGIFKGKYNFQRVFHLLTNLLLFISMIGMMVSGVIISSNVFSFLNIPTTMFGRKLHMVSTSWGFVLMSIHVGLHLGAILGKLNKKMKNNTFEYVYYFVLLLMGAFGLYSFITMNLWEDMFLVNEFKFFDYNQNAVMFYLQYLFILIFIAFVIYWGLALIRKIGSIGKDTVKKK